MSEASGRNLEADADALTVIANRAAAKGETFALSLRWKGSAAREASAWLIPGNDCRQWIDEICRWNVVLSKVRIFVLPTSMADRSPAGVLVLPGSEKSGKPAHIFKPSPLVRPYAAIGDGLYIPVDSDLLIPIAETELRKILLHDICVLRPTNLAGDGLVGFADSDAMGIADLVAPPRLRVETWDRALEAPLMASRLVSIEADPPPTMESIVKTGQDDIGSQSAAPSASEDKSGAGNLAAKAARPLYKFVEWVADHAPRLPGTPGWMDALSNWASARGRDVNPQLDNAREVELQKLLAMMKNDPDQGLRLAIPLRQDRSTRGTAPPSTKLTDRSPDFNLSRVRGGASADSWNVSWQIRQQLLAEYRQAANRELSLGRHRRAAFIFAELLGDFGSAANALRQGKHFREAAALYLEPLRNPQAAAECLLEGGQILEAAGLFEKIGMFEKCGELYQKLNRPEDSRRCYESAVGKHLKENNFIAAAFLLETRLGKPDEAMRVLHETWPVNDPGGECLAQWFEMAGRLGRHEAAGDRVRSFLENAPPAGRALPLARTLANLSKTYPEKSLRTEAADVAIVIVGNRLAEADAREIAPLVQCVTRLSAEDRLLQRDGNRFIEKATDRPRPLPLARGTSTHAPQLLRQFELHPKARWFSVVSQGDAFFALGRLHPVGNTYGLLHGDVGGKMQAIRIAEENDLSLYLVPGRTIPNVILVTQQGKVLDLNETLPSAPSFATPATIGRPSWMPAEGVRGICFSEYHSALVLHEAEGLGVSAFSLSAGRLLARHALADDLAAQFSGPTVMATIKGYRLLVSGGNQALQMSPMGNPTLIDLPHAGKEIAISPVFTRARFAVTMREGAMVIWPDDNKHQVVGTTLFDPVAAFLRDGTLLLISADAGLAFNTHGGKVTHLATFSGPGRPPIAVLPTEAMDEFAVFTTDGVVRVYRAGFGK
jgi:tetratricopeptide (TPR) repeat protein